MSSLLNAFFVWLAKACALFIGILLVLGILNWLKNESHRFAQTIEDIKTRDQEVTNAIAQIASLRQELQNQDPENSGIGSAYSPRDIAEIALKIHSKVESDTWFWHHRFTKQGAKFIATKELAERADIIADKVEGGGPIGSIWRCIKEIYPMAKWVLLSILVMPFLIKGVLYYFIAPLVQKLAPVCINDKQPDKAPRVGSSAISQEIDVFSGRELLIRPEFLQSSTQSAIKRTRWFLNPKFPFSSAFCGMWMLTSIRGEGGASTRVVIAPTQSPDSLSELLMLDLDHDHRLVVHPRALVGIVKIHHIEVGMSKKWRLKNLHSWLTWQLRYLEFSGPCTLVLKGCRGVKAENSSGTSPRLINQAATLAFSSHLRYSNTRCEPFSSYFWGKNCLLNDRFEGGNGIFVYEQMPDLDQQNGTTGGRLEGFWNLLWKAFGI